LVQQEVVFTGKKRYLSDRPEQYAAYIEAAKNYVQNLGDLAGYSYTKPYSTKNVNSDYYNLMYDILNLINVMKIRPHGRVLEVGSGPGWVTEILMGLGYEVDAVEPSAEFIEIAKERIARCIEHYRFQNPPTVNFYCTTLEECTLPDGHYDGILFYAALHHVVDEEKGLAQCARLLCKGGVLGVNESAWIPGYRKLEALLDKEMDSYGTLENPYTVEYLNYLLMKHGFEQIIRYEQVNGLFPIALENSTLKQASQQPAMYSNILTAIKDSAQSLTSLNPFALTSGMITVLESQFDEETRKATLKIQLTNDGETTWLYDASPFGAVTFTLRQGTLGDVDFRETARHRISNNLAPGDSDTLQVEYDLPEDYDQRPWYLELIHEGYFWFSAHGHPATEVKFK